MRIENYIPNKQFRYYYSTLNKYDQNAYDTLLNGLLEFKEKIVINFYDKTRLSLIFSFMKLDIPELFYVQTISVEYKTFGLTPLRIFPKYRFQYSVVCGMLRDMESKYKTFISFGLRSPEIEREQMIHDHIVKKNTYRDADKPYSHEAPGALLYDISVCEGVSKAVKWLCDRMQLKCIVAVGESFANGNLGGHSWNLIWIDNTPYHVDITFDNTISSGSIRYDYFNLSDEEVFEDRTINLDYPLPKCNNSRNWYIENHLFFETRKSLVHYLRKRLKGEPFSFQLPLFDNNEEIVPLVNQIISQNITVSQRGTSYTLRYNLPRMVFEVAFK